MPKKKNRKRVHSSSFIVRSKKKITSRRAPLARRKKVHSLWFGVDGFLHGSSLKTKILIAVGLVLILIPSFFYVNETIQLAFFTPKVPVIQKQYPAPTWISIPSVQMELPVVEEAINNGVWGIADSGISHLNTSARPQEQGPIILYGHNTNERFGPIRWLSIGARITITAVGNKQYVYEVTQTMDVAPSKVSILLSQKGETLILYTCDGFADLQRFVVIAKPVH